MDDECVYRLASLFPPSTLRLSSPWNLFTALEYGNIYSAARGEILYSLFCYFVIFEEMKSKMRVWKARVDKRRLPWCWRVAKRKANAGGSLKLELRRKRELLTEISSARFSARLLVYVTRLFPLFTQQSGRPLWDASRDIELPHSCALLEWFSIHFDESKAIIDRGFVHSYLKRCRRTPTCFNTIFCQKWVEICKKNSAWSKLLLVSVILNAWRTHLFGDEFQLPCSSLVGWASQ